LCQVFGRASPDGEIELEIRKFVALLRRWWWLVALCAVLAGSLAYLLTPEPTPIFEATTKLLLSQGAELLPDVDEVARGQRLASTYGELIRTRSVMEQVIVDLGLPTDAEALASTVAVTNITGTNILELSVRGSDAQQTADIANEIVLVFIEQNQRNQSSRYASSRQSLEQEISDLQADIEENRGTLYQVDDEVRQLQTRIEAIDRQEAAGSITSAQVSERNTLEEQLATKLVEQDRLELISSQQQTRYQTLLTSYEEVRVLEAQSTAFMTVVEEALPGQQVTPRPRKQLNALQGAVGGAVVALGAVALIENLRVSIQSSEEIEKLTGLPTIGVIANMNGASTPDTLVTVHQPRTPIAEAYRLLRTNLEFAAGDKEPMRTLVVTSSSPREGKTTTAANLAVAMANSGKRVILVDTDLRRPALHKLFEQTNTRGVTTALLQDNMSMLSDHVVSTGVENLYLMPSGPLPPNPADLISSNRMSVLIHELARHADYVIFDTPPLLAVADANLMARKCDAAVLVVLASATGGDMLKRAADQIAQACPRLLGVVLNRASASGSGYYYYYHYY
jgi:non-specific protein-tyrosine kinase